MQLDLFSHSRNVMLRNDLVEALKARDASASARALAALAAEFPQDATLAPATRLIDRLAVDLPPFAAHADALRAVTHLEGETRADATALFGQEPAGLWLRPAWQALGLAAARLPYRPDAADAHAAGLFMRACNWAEVEQGVAGIESWRRIPRPLEWAAEAAFHLHGLDNAWPLLAELAWLDSARFAGLARRLPAKGLARLVQDYEREFAATPPEHAWFPAWALITHPELRLVLQSARTPERSTPEQTCHTLIALLGLERQGRHADVVEHRRRLNAQHPELFAYYMQTRA